jgi:RimJ/RimL family protein N-acetyltransferase
LAGAVLSQIQPGRTAVVWPPRIVSGEPRGTAARLMAATRQRLAAGDVRIAQAMLDRHVPADERILQEAGFEYLTDLLYLVCLEVELPGSLPRGPLEFEPYSAAGHHRLARMVKATYERTLDCPRLNGVRKIEEVLAGYRATGLFDPNRWLIVRHRGRDVGCLLLADHPEHKNEELVYMGLAASERGHGWGMDVTRHAQWLTRRAGRSRLVLAVDAENGPAIKVYAAAGFRAWDRRRVYVKVFASQG